MKKVLKEIENINTNPNRLALEKFIDILAFIAENSIDYTKEYTIFYEEIKSNKMDKIDAPSLKELKLRFYSFIHIKRSKRANNIIKYWNKKHLSVLIFFFAYIKILANLHPNEYKNIHWVELSNLLPTTTPESLKYKYLSLKYIALHTRNVWSNNEDLTLTELIKQYEPKLLDEQSTQFKIKWIFLAMKLNFKTQSNKLGKQCKERWFNHLNPNLNKKIWTKPEDIELLESAIVHNKKWSKIVQFFSGRNQHSLKNRFIRLIAREQRVSIKKITIKENCSNAIISDTLATLRKLDRASETVETKTNIDLQNSNNGDKEVSNILKTPLLMENTSPNNSPLEFPFSFREVSPLRSSDFSIDDFLRISDFKGYLFDCE